MVIATSKQSSLDISRSIANIKTEQSRYVGGYYFIKTEQFRYLAGYYSIKRE